MKKQYILAAFVLMCAAIGTTWGQNSPAERRAFRQYTSPEELVSIAPTTAFDNAMSIISNVSQKFVGKVIVDPRHRSEAIGIDIEGMQWRDALEAILRQNQMWYKEYESYIEITGLPGSEKLAGAQGSAATEIQKEVASISSREIKISAVFFEVNLTRLDEVGINWNFMKSTNDVDVGAQITGADRISGEVFKTEITPKLSFANIDVVAKLFSNYELGEVLSGPQLIVRSGEEGRIQVGQDFSIKERDFAGNLIDKFYSAGTIITVKPQVITEKGVDFVHMVVDVERSSVVPGALTTLINKTKANTNLLLLDGEETIIGGLYNNEVNTVRTGIPFLKDLPWYVLGLRYLFGYNKEEVKKKELIILMKAELVPTLEDRIAQKKMDDGIFNRWLHGKMNQEQHITGKKE